ncbi:MAG TPA: polysaccharide biosynthesis/export family protein [Longimicrobium sp.]|nr:polysaccharide biosynthesis/export family protein [Longimicrobium sp.]
MHLSLPLLTVAVLLSAGTVAAQGGTQPPSTAPAAQPVPEDTSAITLRPGDLLRIQVWREPDLQGEFQVDVDGVVILPLIGEKRVTGIPVRRLRESLIEDYRVHLRNPSINITPLRRIHVLGAVRQPGMYPVDPTVTLADAVALAGGTVEGGDLRRLRIERRGVVIRERVAAGETLRQVDLRSGDQIYIERRPWLQRNGATVIGMAISATNLALNLIRIRRAG